MQALTRSRVLTVQDKCDEEKEEEGGRGACGEREDIDATRASKGTKQPIHGVYEDSEIGNIDRR